MLRSRRAVNVVAVLAGLALTACAEGGVAPSGIKPGEALLSEAASGVAGESYVIIGADNVLPSDLDARLAAIGGTLLRAHPEIGVAVATGSDGFRAAAAAIPGVESVAQNLLIEQPQPDRAIDLVSEQPATSLDASGTDPGENVASSADSDPFYFFQWAPGAVSAPEAWNAGYRGAGARVAILDGGLHNTHPDLAGRVDAAVSKSYACFPRLAVCPASTMTPWNSDVGTLWHGTHVAGIVAASDNNIGVVGIAPQATLIGVKVLHAGSGQFSWSIDAIMYASTPVGEGGAGAE
jgi:subtilisin family serine protease